jgi:hypothetical protein
VRLHAHILVSESDLRPLSGYACTANDRPVLVSKTKRERQRHE